MAETIESILRNWHQHLHKEILDHRSWHYVRSINCRGEGFPPTRLCQEPPQLSAAVGSRWEGIKAAPLKVNSYPLWGLGFIGSMVEH